MAILIGGEKNIENLNEEAEKWGNKKKKKIQGWWPRAWPQRITLEGMGASLRKACGGMGTFR